MECWQSTPLSPAYDAPDLLLALFLPGRPNAAYTSEPVGRQFHDVDTRTSIGNPDIIIEIMRMAARRERCGQSFADVGPGCCNQGPLILWRWSCASIPQ